MSLEKEAIGLGTRMAANATRAFRTTAASPVGRSAMVGAAGGAIGGAVTGDPDQNIVSRAATGAVAGGLGGAAVGSMRGKPNLTKTAFWNGFEKQAGAGQFLGKKIFQGKKLISKTMKGGGNIAKDVADRAKDMGGAVVDTAKEVGGGIASATKATYHGAKNMGSGLANKVKNEFTEFQAASSGKTVAKLKREQAAAAHLKEQARKKALKEEHRLANPRDKDLKKEFDTHLKKEIENKPKVTEAPAPVTNSNPAPVNTAPAQVAPAPVNNAPAAKPVEPKQPPMKDWHKDLAIGAGGVGVGMLAGHALKPEQQKAASIMAEYLK